MTPLKEFEHKLIVEYGRAEETLVRKFSAPLTKQAAKGAIDSTLLVTSAMQTNLILTEIPAEYLAGIYIESDILASKMPAYVGFDFSGASRTGINKLTKDTIGHIGNFNEEIANELKLRYGNLVSDNELLTQLDKHGWTAHTEKRMVKMGFDKETINLVKHQTTTNKMIQILEQQGIRGNIPPNEVARQLVPHIKGIFGDKGVTIDNIGRVRKVLSVDADGKYKWINKKVTRAFHTTTNNYADIIARSTILDANRLARHETLQQSDFVKAYRSIAVMDERTGYYDAMMHGVIVKMGDGPPYHAMCRCEYEPIWKESTGLSNRPNAYYEDKRDKFFWKQHQLKAYNTKLPKGSKIPNANFLPAAELKGMPGKEGMRTIRAEMLKQPLDMSDKGIADLLWTKTAKDGLEHGMIINKEHIFVTGTKNKIYIGARGKDLKNITAYHTHPNWDSPPSSGDVGAFLYYGNQKSMAAISNKHIHKLTRTNKTPTLGFNEANKVDKAMVKFIDNETRAIYQLNPKRSTESIYREAMNNANRRMAKKYHYIYGVTPR